MKLLILLITSCIIWSCDDTKSKIVSEKPFVEVKEYKDSRTSTERQRDSIRILNLLTILSVVRNSPEIDSKKISSAPFNKMDFNKVVAYSYDGSHEQISIAPKNGNTRSASNTIDKQIGLNQKQANTILSLFSKRSTYDPMASAGCFEPRFALVLYKEESSVMEISVCMDCNNIRCIPEIKENKDGISKKGRKSIIAFCREIKFPYGELNQ